MLECKGIEVSHLAVWLPVIGKADRKDGWQKDNATSREFYHQGGLQKNKTLIKKIISYTFLEVIDQGTSR